MSSIPIQASGGGVVHIGTVTLADGTQAVMHVLCDGTGVPYSPTRPLLTAPAILAADFASHPDTVAVANAVFRTVPPNTSRSGGFVQAGPLNTGKITVTLARGDGTTLVYVLSVGDSFSLSVAPGKVLQQGFTLAGDTVGDTVSTVEYL